MVRQGSAKPSCDGSNPSSTSKKSGHPNGCPLFSSACAVHLLSVRRAAACGEYGSLAAGRPGRNAASSRRQTALRFRYAGYGIAPYAESLTNGKIKKSKTHTAFLLFAPLQPLVAEMTETVGGGPLHFSAMIGTGKGGFVMTIGERIGALRRAAGLSQERLAEQLGVSRQAIGKWEAGVSHS